MALPIARASVRTSHASGHDPFRPRSESPPFPCRRAMGLPARPLHRLRGGSGGAARVGSPADRAHDRRRDRGFDDRTHPRPRHDLRGDAGDHRVHDRARHAGIHRGRSGDAMARVWARRPVHHRHGRSRRVAAGTLAGAAGDERDLGFRPGWRRIDDAVGRSLRRRRPPRGLHAISARAVRDERGLARCEHGGEPTSGSRDRLVPPGRLVVLRGHAGRGLAGCDFRQGLPHPCRCGALAADRGRCALEHRGDAYRTAAVVSRGLLCPLGLVDRPADSRAKALPIAPARCRAFLPPYCS